MVSIFTPTHDSKFLTEAYESLKTQTRTDWEWIILYNHDAEEIEFNDKRVKSYRVYHAPEWVGTLKAIACEHATGDILLELDHDDLLMPTAIEDVEKAFEDESIGFVYSNCIHSTGDFQPTQRFDERYGWKFRTVNVNGHDLDEHIHFEPTPNCISRIWFAPNHLRAFRKSVYDAVGGYNKEMRILDDLDLMCRLYCVTTFKHIDKGLYVYRVHGENTWLRFNAEIQNNVYRIHDMYIESLAEKWAKDNDLLCVELGGRIGAKKGYTKVDLIDADIIADLDEDWPFENDSVGVVRAFDIFEHLKNPIHIMNELFRVLAPGGYAIIQVPSTDGRGAFQDPTHVSFWNENSFLYYTDKYFNKFIQCPVRFQVLRLFTSEKDSGGVCWTTAHLVKLDDSRVPGEVKI